MASNSISDRIQPIDQSKTNRLTKNDFIKAYLCRFAQENYRPHYSDRFTFNVPTFLLSQVCFGKRDYTMDLISKGACQ
jgi:hypothetical protein